MRIVKRLLAFVVGAALVFVALLALGIRQNHLPLDDPPGSFVRLYVYLNTHVAETIDGSPFPELRPRTYTLAADALFAKVKDAIKSLPRWEIVESAEDARQLHAVVTSSLFRFKDDVTVAVVPQPGGRPVVTVRAVSRVGKGDLGTNTRHVLDLYDALEQVGAHGVVERMSH
ncbi:MAG: DUF1499 domain-containing protein [Deltaproteobacteria bacterium]|nr:DUF1499 domain-containing protein [Deltaproteobacteria bacterium]